MKASEKLYRKSPYFLKVLFLNAIGFLNKRLRYSDNFKRYFEEYKVLWNANSETLDTFQSEQLKKLLLESHSSSEWYQKIMRENGISQKMIENDPFEALAKMPILTKSDRKENPTKIAVKHRETNAKGYTSGTSGSPTVNFMDKESIERSFALWKRFHWTLGIQKNDRHIRLSGRLIIKPERNSPPFWIYNHPEHQLLMSTYHLKQEFLRHYVKKIDTFKPVYLDGYPSAVFVLAKYINENSIVIKNTPKAIAVTAETLYDYQKAEIEKAFKCKVFNQYASSEGSPFITACKEGNLHVNIDSGVFEFLDRNNTPSKPGEVGRMIVTSFRNLKTPLIRYDIGDTVLLNKSDTPCS